MSTRFRKGVLASITVLICLAASSAWAAVDDMPVPAKLQAMILKKVVGFDQALSKKVSFSVGVVYNSESQLMADEVVREFGSNGVSAELVRMDDLESKLANYDVIYLAPGTADAKSVIDGSGKLSVSGVPDFVNSGTVSVAIGEANGKPSILIHQGRLSQEQHEFSSKLLKLATVVG